MKLSITDQNTGADLLLISGEQAIDHLFYTRDREKKYFTIAWNHGEKQQVTIDGEAHEFMPNTIPPSWRKCCEVALRAAHLCL
jgi:AraC family transcriptional activator of pobA